MIKAEKNIVERRQFLLEQEKIAKRGYVDDVFSDLGDTLREVKKEKNMMKDARDKALFNKFILKEETSSNGTKVGLKV